MNNHLTLILYGSPLARTPGKLVLATILIALFLLSLPGFKEYYTVYPLQLIVGILIAAVFYSPHLVNVLGGGNIIILLVVLTGGTLLYVRRSRCSVRWFLPQVTTTWSLDRKEATMMCFTS